MTPHETAPAGPAAMHRGWAALQVLVVTLCFLLNMLDGADVTIMSFLAPKLAQQWAVQPQVLGVLLSASLAGMGVGCLFVAPLADWFGRRTMIIIALALVSAAMIYSGYAPSVVPLMAARFLVGVGVGTIGVSMTAMASEFAPPRFANLAVGFVQAGWPLAAVFTAFVAAAVIPVSGWQIMLLGIGLVSAALLAVVWIILPESVAFLEKRRPSGALEKLNALRGRLGDAPLAALPALPVASDRFTLAALFDEGRGRTSLLLWIAVTLGFFVVFFVVSWIPKLATQAGLPMSEAIYAGASYNLGSFMGTSAIGWVAVRYRIHQVIAAFFAAGVAAMMVFGAAAMPVAVTLLMALAVGATVNGGFNGFWSLAAALYPARMRGTGVGWAMGLGRIGAVLGPIAGGYLVAARWPISAIFAFYAVPLALSAGLCLMIRAGRAEA